MNCFNINNIKNIFFKKYFNIFLNKNHFEKLPITIIYLSYDFCQVIYVGNLAEIENRIEKDLGCTLSNLVEYNTYENGTLTPFSL